MATKAKREQRTKLLGLPDTQRPLCFGQRIDDKPDGCMKCNFYLTCSPVKHE